MNAKEVHVLSFLKEYRLKVKDRPALERTFSFIQVILASCVAVPRDFHLLLTHTTYTAHSPNNCSKATHVSSDRATRPRRSLSSRASLPILVSRDCSASRRT